MGAFVLHTPEIPYLVFRVMPSYYNLGAQLKGRSIRTNWAARKATPQSKYLHFYRRCTPIIKIFTWNFPTYLKFPSAGMKSVKCLFCHITYFHLTKYYHRLL